MELLISKQAVSSNNLLIPKGSVSGLSPSGTKNYSAFFKDEEEQTPGGETANKMSEKEIIRFKQGQRYLRKLSLKRKSDKNNQSHPNFIEY